MPTTLAPFDVRFPLLIGLSSSSFYPFRILNSQRPWESRSPLKRAVRGMVPEPVLRRHDKSSPVRPLPAPFGLIQGTVSRRLTASRMEADSFVDIPKLERAVERMRGGSREGMPELIPNFSLKIWLEVGGVREGPERRDSEEYKCPLIRGAAVLTEGRDTKGTLEDCGRTHGPKPADA